MGTQSPPHVPYTQPSIRATRERSRIETPDGAIKHQPKEEEEKKKKLGAYVAAYKSAARGETASFSAALICRQEASKSKNGVTGGPLLLHYLSCMARVYVTSVRRARACVWLPRGPSHFIGY